MNDKFIYIYDVECKQSFIINTQQIVWIDINSQSMMMSASSDKGLFHLDEESTKAIIEVVNKGAKNCCHGDYSKQVGGRYISEDTVIEWLKDQDIIKTSGQEKEARKQLDELPSVAISADKGLIRAIQSVIDSSDFPEDKVHRVELMIRGEIDG